MQYIQKCNLLLGLKRSRVKLGWRSKYQPNLIYLSDRKNTRLDHNKDAGKTEKVAIPTSECVTLRHHIIQGAFPRVMVKIQLIN